MAPAYRVTEHPPDAPEVAEALAIRAAWFGVAGDDRDRFDARARHFLIRQGDRAVGTFRLIWHRTGAELAESYTAQFYDLAPLMTERRPLAELGRFATARGLRDPEIVRAAWARLTRIVDEEGLGMFLGCSSFLGTDPAPHAAQFAALQARFLGPEALRPGVAAPETRPLAEFAGADTRGALTGLPPMLRAYLSMGGWVGDHLVIDRALGTCHVFTALDIDAIPESRKRLMRAAAADLAPD